MNYILMAALLLPMAVLDIRYQRLSLRWMILVGLLGLTVNITRNEWGIQQVIAGTAAGVVLIMFSQISVSIGSGDGVLFLSIGMICGWEQCILLFCASIFSSLPVGLFLKFVKHKSGHDTIPFVPFVLIAWLGLTYLRMAGE